MTHRWRHGIRSIPRIKIGFSKLGSLGDGDGDVVRLAAGGFYPAQRRRRALLAFVCALGAVQGRPYPCGQCPAAFARRPYLDTHMRTHTGERPYQCDACLKRFTQKSSLNIHKRTHTGGSLARAGLALRPPAASLLRALLQPA